MLQENGQTSDNLMAVTVPVISNEDCNKMMSGITDRMFCAGFPEGGKDSCQVSLHNVTKTNVSVRIRSVLSFEQNVLSRVKCLLSYTPSFQAFSIHLKLHSSLTGKAEENKIKCNY